MRISDRLRVEGYVQRYDFWLDAHGAPGRVRRGLVRELRANLAAAAADDHLEESLQGLGEPRALAGAAAEATADTTRPRWGMGLSWAVAAAACYFLLTMMALACFFDGVRASGVHRQVTGPLWLVPGVQATAEESSRTFSAGLTGFPWLLLPLMLVVFVAVAKPWRLWAR